MIEDFSQSLEGAVADYAEQRPKDQKWCNFFWGSHGCDLPEGDHRLHRCGTEDNPCMEYDEDRPADSRVRWWVFPDRLGPLGEWGSWTDYHEGWRQVPGEPDPV